MAQIFSKSSVSLSLGSGSVKNDYEPEPCQICYEPEPWVKIWAQAQGSGLAQEQEHSFQEGWCHSEVAKRAVKINQNQFVTSSGEHADEGKLINYSSESTETFQIGSGWLFTTYGIKF